jgi:hypothetical protein
VAFHTHLLPGGWTVGPLVAAVLRHHLTPSTWTTIQIKFDFYRESNTCSHSPVVSRRLTMESLLITVAKQQRFLDRFCSKNRLWSRTNRNSLEPTQPPVQWVPGVLSPGVKRGRGVTLTTHPHLVPRPWMSRSYTSSPPKRLRGV